MACFGLFEEHELNTDEIVKLSDMLEDEGIPHDFTSHSFGGGYHLFYPSAEDCVCSAITTRGSFGWEEGLIEIYGLLTEEESFDEVKGHLSADNVFARIKKHYENNYK